MIDCRYRKRFFGETLAKAYKSEMNRVFHENAINGFFCLLKRQLLLKPKIFIGYCEDWIFNGIFSVICIARTICMSDYIWIKMCFAYLASGKNSLIFVSSISLSIVICLTPTFLEYLICDGNFVGCAKIMRSPCTPCCITCAISCCVRNVIIFY